MSNTYISAEPSAVLFNNLIDINIISRMFICNQISDRWYSDWHRCSHYPSIVRFLTEKGDPDWSNQSSLSLRHTRFHRMASSVTSDARRVFSQCSDDSILFECFNKRFTPVLVNYHWRTSNNIDLVLRGNVLPLFTDDILATRTCRISSKQVEPSWIVTAIVATVIDSVASRFVSLWPSSRTQSLSSKTSRRDTAELRWKPRANLDELMLTPSPISQCERRVSFHRWLSL